MPRFVGRKATATTPGISNSKKDTPIRLSQLRIDILQDPGRYDLGVLDAFIAVLDPGLIQSTYARVLASSDWKEQFDRALHALAGIATVARHCKTAKGISSSLVGSTVERLVSVFQDIVYWIGYLLHFGYTIHSNTSGTVNFPSAYFSHSHTLLSILSLGPRLDECFKSSPSAIDLVLQLWTKQNLNGEPFADFVLNAEPTSCPILRLMAHCLGSKEGLAAIVDRVYSKPARVAAVFIAMTTTRSRMVYRRLTDEANNPYRRYAPPLTCLLYFGDLCEVIYRLVPDKRIWDSFLKVQFVNDMTTTALTLPKHVSNPMELLLISAQVFRTFFVHSRGVLWSLEAMFSLGFFNSFMSLVSSSKAELVEPKPGSQIVAITDAVLQLLDVSAVWPRILKRLEARIAETPKHMWDSVENLPSVGLTWRHFRVTVEERLQVDASLNETIVLCENPYCRSKTTLLRTATQSKKCSGCRSFTYCSVSCQRQDWNNFHRDECKYACLEHREKKRYVELYTHRMRAFHIALMERRFNLFIARHIDRTRPEKRPKDETETGTFSPSTDLATSQTKLYKFDASQPYSRIMCIPPGDYQWRELPICDQPYVRRRFEEGFLRETGECDPTNGHPEGPDLAGETERDQFVEGIFSMGDKEVMVMVKMRVHTDKATDRSKFCAASSVVRIGRRKPKDWSQHWQTL